MTFEFAQENFSIFISLTYKSHNFKKQNHENKNVKEQNYKNRNYEFPEF